MSDTAEKPPQMVMIVCAGSMMPIHCDNRNKPSSPYHAKIAINLTGQLWDKSGMEKIDGEWIKTRLSGQRGEKKRLADAIGIDTTMLSKVLSGLRRLSASETEAVLMFFGEAAQLTPKAAGILARVRKLSPEGQDRASALVDALLATEAAEKAGQAPDL